MRGMRAMRRTSVAVVSLAAALALSACGGSTDSATTGETSSAIKGGVQDAEDDPAASEVEAEVEAEAEAEAEAEVVEAEVEADNQELPSNDVCPDLKRADIFTCLQSNGNFTIFLNITRLNDDLREDLYTGGPFTVFAFTDDAFEATFEALGEKALGLLYEDEELLRKILTHHIKDGVYDTDDLFTGGSEFLDDVGFSAIEESLDGVITVDGAVVTSRDNVVDNGIIHVIDKVLIPKGAGELLNP